MPWSIAAFARPVRIAVNSSLVTSTDFFILASASFRMLGMSSLTGCSSVLGGCSWSIVPHRQGPAGGLRCTAAARGGGRGRAGAVLRRSAGDDRADAVAAHGAGDVAGAVQAEHHHRLGVVHAEAEGGGVHDLQAALEGVVVGDVLELARVGVGARIGVVDP